MDAPPASRPARKGCGRRKIEIKYIENQRKRWVAFSKRKKGLLSKASQLAKITGEDIGVVIISEQGRSYGSQNAEAVIKRYKEIVKDGTVQKNDHRDDNAADGVNQRSRAVVKDDNQKRGGRADHDHDATARPVIRRYRSKLKKSKETVKEGNVQKNDHREDNAAAAVNQRSKAVVKDDDQKRDGRADHDATARPVIHRHKSKLKKSKETVKDDTGRVIRRHSSKGTAREDHRDDDNNGKSGNRRMVNEQRVIQWFDFMGIEDRNIKSEKFSFDLNKTPDEQD